LFFCPIAVACLTFILPQPELAPLPLPKLSLHAVDVFVVKIGKRNDGADNQTQESQFDIHSRNLLDPTPFVGQILRCKRHASGATLRALRALHPSVTGITQAKQHTAMMQRSMNCGI
jgi:hypothetical protein